VTFIVITNTSPDFLRGFRAALNAIRQQLDQADTALPVGITPDPRVSPPPDQGKADADLSPIAANLDRNEMVALLRDWITSGGRDLEGVTVFTFMDMIRDAMPEWVATTPDRDRAFALTCTAPVHIALRAIGADVANASHKWVMGWVRVSDPDQADPENPMANRAPNAGVKP
jgi:hypothetical protein